MKILMVLTSHDQLGNTGKKTGFWLEEFAAPYYAFKDTGAHVTLVSPKGGVTVTVVRPALVVTNAVDTQSDPLTYSFEVYTNADLSAASLVAQNP